MHCHRRPLPECNTSSTDIRLTINKWGLLKLQNFCEGKGIVKKTKWKPTQWEKIFTYPVSDRGLIFKRYKELKKLDIKIIK